MPTKTIPSGTVADAYLAAARRPRHRISLRQCRHRFRAADRGLRQGAGPRHARAQAHHRPARERRHQHGAGLLPDDRPAAGGDGACQCRHRERDVRPDQCLARQYPDAVHRRAARPTAEEGGLPGERSGEIHWPQEMRDQRAMTREFMKWDYELPNGQVLESALDRALNIAMTEPRGPVYMTLPREMLAAPIENFRYASPSRHRTPSAPYPDPNAIDEAADLIANAEYPLIITSGAGASTPTCRSSPRSSERFAIPVVQRKNRYMCLADDHPMHIGYDPDAHLDDCRRRHRARMRRAVDPAQEIAARRCQDHPYRRRSDLRQLSAARLRLRSRDPGRHRRDACRRSPKRWPRARSAPPRASMPAANASR